MNRTITNLPEDPAELKKLITSLHFHQGFLEAEVANLRHRLGLYSHQKYGKSSETTHSLQKSFLFDEAEASCVEAIQEKSAEEATKPETITVPEHTRQKPKRKPIPDDLPRVDVMHDLSEDEKVCKKSGCVGVLKKIGEEVSEQLDIVPAKVQVLRHIRGKYACPCCESNIKTAELPPQPIPKSLASPGLLAHVAVSKYQDALPLYRQEKILARSGIELSRATLAFWMIEVGENLLVPLLNLLWDELLSSTVISMDETPMRVLKRNGEVFPGRGYVWVMVRGGMKPVRLFEYDYSRSGKVAKRLIPGDYTGYLVVDGYEGYNALCARPEIKRAGCWAHARRKFTDVLKSSPKTAQPLLAKQALEMIGKLYAIERECKDFSDELRFTYRQTNAVPILNSLSDWLNASQSLVPQKSPTGRAMNYLSEQWPRLICYLENGQVPIDNNLAENSIRPFAIGRKNWLFSDTEAGAKGSAAIYSIIETAKANDLNPYDYLRHLLTELPKAKNLSDYENLLPWNYKPGPLH